MTGVPHRFSPGDGRDRQPPRRQQTGQMGAKTRQKEAKAV